MSYILYWFEVLITYWIGLVPKQKQICIDKSTFQATLKGCLSSFCLTSIVVKSTDPYSNVASNWFLSQNCKLGFLNWKIEVACWPCVKSFVWFLLKYDCIDFCYTTKPQVSLTFACSLQIFLPEWINILIPMKKLEQRSMLLVTTCIIG